MYCLFIIALYLAIGIYFMVNNISIDGANTEVVFFRFVTQEGFKIPKGLFLLLWPYFIKRALRRYYNLLLEANL